MKLILSREAHVKLLKRLLEQTPKFMKDTLLPFRTIVKRYLKEQTKLLNRKPQNIY